MSDDNPSTEKPTAAPMLPTKIPPQDDNLFSAYRACGQIQPLPPEEHSHWHVDDWHRGRPRLG